jgi:hypothetical protein
MFARENISPEV